MATTKFFIAAAAALFAGGNLCAQAQTYVPGAAAASSRDKNVVHLDILAPIAASLENSLGGGHGVMTPLLVSYERRLGSNGSLGVEVLYRGGTPELRRSGMGLFGRWYLLNAERTEVALAGLYLSPVLSYRSVNSEPTAFNTPINSGRRGGAGALVGWQLPLGRPGVPHLVFDFAVGGLVWARLGDDRTSDPAYYDYVHEPIFRRTGFLPDVRYGLGFQF